MIQLTSRNLGICALFVIIGRIIADIEVTCNFGYPYDWENIGKVYTCTVKNFNVRIPHENVTKILGEHQQGKTHADVTKLNIQEQTCEFFPRGFEQFFPNLEGLRVAGSGLVSLTHWDLKVFPKLRNCDMFNNYLIILESDVFQYNPQLEYLYFGDNNLKRIGFDVFKPILSNLRKAIFQSNHCVNKNANLKEQVPELQRVINAGCSLTDARVSQDELKITQLQEQRKNFEEMIQKDEEMIQKLEATLKEQNENVWLNIFTGACVVLVLLAFAGALTVYFMKRRVRVNYTGDDAENFFPTSLYEGDHEASPQPKVIYANENVEPAARMENIYEEI